MKQVIVVRKDLEMSPGKCAAQCCHASLTSFVISTKGHSHTAVHSWFETGQTKIVVMIDDEEQLLTLRDILKEVNIPHYLVKDEGRTELKGSNYTCLGIGPVEAKEIDQYTRSLKLYR